MNDVFEENYRRLNRMAERILGSALESEDAVQEAFLRLLRNKDQVIENILGWLTTVTVRICLDRLRANKGIPFDQEEYIDDREGAPGRSSPPETSVTHLESIGQALHVLSDQLRPQERVAFVLHDVFGFGYHQISQVLDCSEENSRQLASRARRKVHPGSPPDEQEISQQLVEAFLSAAREGDFHRLVSLLHPECVLVADDVALALGTPRNVRGGPAVAEFFNGKAAAAQVAWVDGTFGAVWAPQGTVRVAFLFSRMGDKITSIEIVADEETLKSLWLRIISNEGDAHR